MPELHSYADAEAWLLSLTDYERLLGNAPVAYNTRTFDRDHFRDQMARLGNPQRNFAVIHVAGTKGKGSTCAFIESALRACGLKTGLYTSPHLVRFTERLRVNGVEVSDGKFCDLLQRAGSHVMEEGPNGSERSFRTVFEILTAAALTWFSDEGVDVAVVETGLGGRLDSTNVFHADSGKPRICVITAIGLDHTAILGDTIEAIAGEKAGIIQQGSRVVVAPQTSKEVFEVVRSIVGARADEVKTGGVPVFVEEEFEISTEAGSDGCGVIRRAGGAAGVADNGVRQGVRVCPSLKGVHQRSNAATALAALGELERAWRQNGDHRADRLRVEGIVRGLENTCWPGRFEVINVKGVPVVVDGAHCMISARALGRTCREVFGGAKAIAVTGFLKDKAGAEMLEAFSAETGMAGAVAVAPPTPRSVSVEAVAQVLRARLGPDNVRKANDVEDAISQAIEMAEAVGGYVVVFGSLYLAGPALESLRGNRFN